MNELKPCPFCGGENIKIGAYSICPDCLVVCENCNASIELTIPWKENESEKEHGERCWKALEEAWNRRVNDER